MQKKSRSNSARVTRRNFAAGAGAAAFVAGIAPFNIVRAQGGPLKVGVLLPRSGLQAGIGQSCQLGVDIAPTILKSLGMPDLAIMSAIRNRMSRPRARVRKS
jgi:branched-chain amino acid transport system substrate-binding protein